MFVRCALITCSPFLFRICFFPYQVLPYSSCIDQIWLQGWKALQLQQSDLVTRLVDIAVGSARFGYKVERHRCFTGDIWSQGWEDIAVWNLLLWVYYKPVREVYLLRKSLHCRFCGKWKLRRTAELSIWLDPVMQGREYPCPLLVSLLLYNLFVIREQKASWSNSCSACVVVSVGLCIDIYCLHLINSMQEWFKVFDILQQIPEVSSNTIWLDFLPS
jgi:hypothetical protein